MTVNAGAAGRRAGVLAASSGLVVSLGVTAAYAAPVSHHTGNGAGKTDAGRDSAGLSSAPATTVASPRVEAPQITVPADVTTAQVSSIAGTLIAPPPPPPPPVVRPRAVTRAPEVTSRSAVRAAAAPDTGPADSSPTGSDPSSAQLSVTRANIMAVAARYVGIAYVYGGTTPAGFDCSGYTSYVFAQVGITLPRTSSAQAASAQRISRSEALPGDLVFMPGHIGIYAGDGMMYDSPRTGSAVSKRAMWSSEFGFYRVLSD